MNRRNYAYQIPDIKDLALKDGLSAQLKDLWSESRENNFQIYLYAAGLRNQYLDKKTNIYSDEFQKWYVKENLTELFGKMASFSKYASAGDAVNYFGQEYRNGKYINKLPLSRIALYELSLLINETSEVQLEKLLFRGGEDGEGLIHPSATAAELATYRQSKLSKTKPATKARKTQFSIPLATIYASKDLYKFHKVTGEHVGNIDLDDAEKILNRLKTSIDTKFFDIRDNLKKITTAYKKKKAKQSPSAALRTEKKTTEKKR